MQDLSTGQLASSAMVLSSSASPREEHYRGAPDGGPYVAERLSSGGLICYAGLEGDTNSGDRSDRVGDGGQAQQHLVEQDVIRARERGCWSTGGMANGGSDDSPPPLDGPMELAIDNCVFR